MAYPAASPAWLRTADSLADMTVPGPLKVEKLEGFGLGSAVFPASAAKPVQTTSSSRTSLKQPRALLIQIPGLGAKAWIRQTTKVVSVLGVPQPRRPDELTRYSSYSDASVQPAAILGITACSSQNIATEADGVAG